ncbi:MAG TPA: hypothetical protein VFE71_04425, partial [Bacteroidales bacterium]|nr:hypothetical protein [Bacteroidales bacterium]
DVLQQMPLVVTGDAPASVKVPPEIAVVWVISVISVVVIEGMDGFFSQDTRRMPDRHTIINLLRFFIGCKGYNLFFRLSKYGVF